MPLRAHAFLPLLLGLLAASSARGDDAENLERLRSMPPEQRRALERKLKEFEALPAPQKEAIRKLNAELAALDPEARAKYLAVMRRYHGWRRTLQKSQVKAIDELPPEKRLKKIVQILGETRWGATDTRKSDQVQVELSTMSLQRTAFLLRVWVALADDERKELQKTASNRRVAKLESFAAEHEIPPPENPLAALPRIRAEIAAKRPRVARKIGQGELRNEGRDALPATKKGEEIASKGVDFYYLLTHSPGPINAADLRKFDENMPAFLRETLDPLPPDAARRRLRVLFELVYPPGTESIKIPGPLDPAPKPAQGAAPKPSSGTPGDRAF